MTHIWTSPILYLQYWIIGIILWKNTLYCLYSTQLTSFDSAHWLMVQMIIIVEYPSYNDRLSGDASEAIGVF